MPQEIQSRIESKIKKFVAPYDFQIIAVVISALLSFIALSYHQPFNIDGIIYLKSATSFLEGGIHDAASVYPWPFYSILIAIFHHFTHLSLENSAFLLNGILTTITVLAFIALIKEMGGNNRVLFFATLLILIYPYLTHDRDNILRDFGYYAFALTSVLFFIRYLRTLSWFYALAWGIALILATLFRIEGIVFLSILPFAIFLYPKLNFSQRCYAFLKINVLNIIGVFFILIWVLIKYRQNHYFPHLGRIREAFDYFSHGITIMTDNFSYKITILSNSLFKNGNFNPSFVFLISGLIGIFLDIFIRTMSLLYLFLSYYALRHKLLRTDAAVWIGWYAYISLNILIIGFILVSQFLLTERYLTFLCLLIILLTPFSLNFIFEQWKNRQKSDKKNWLFPLVCILLIATTIEAVGHFGTSKTYIIQAGNWINKNTLSTDTLYTNDTQLFYYSHRPGFTDVQMYLNTCDPLTAMKRLLFKNYHYTALVLHHDQLSEENEIIALVQTPPVASFKNRKGDKSIIFVTK